MNEDKFNRIINFIREEMVANAPGTGGGGGSHTDPTGKNGLVGFDPINGKKKFATGGRGSRKHWLKFLKTKSKPN